MTTAFEKEINTIMLNRTHSSHYTNTSIFIHIEGASFCLIDCQHHLSLLYTQEENCFDKKTNFYRDTLFYTGPISPKTYWFAKKTSCDGRLANYFASNPAGKGLIN